MAMQALLGGGACLCEAVQGLGNTHARSCKGAHSCAHLCKALCTSWCEHCSPQGRVLHAGGEPAPGIGVRVTVGVTGATSPPPIEFRADTTGAIVIPINVPSGATALDLSVEAGQADGPPAQAQMTVAPVEAVSGRFLLLGGPGGPLQPGEVLRLQLRDLGPPPAPRLFHVLAVARGRLVAAQAVQRGTVTEVTLPVTPAMVPRLRVVAFFQAGGQLVAASWGAPVGDSCGDQVLLGALGHTGSGGDSELLGVLGCTGGRGLGAAGSTGMY
ncbi:Complement C4-like protein [Aix galericulata]|nr:Complement C4-like protein [Aix galericulata]